MKIGDYITYSREHDCTCKRYGVIQQIKGRNILIDGNWEYDIVNPVILRYTHESN